MTGQEEVFALLIAQTWQVTLVAAFAWCVVKSFASDRPHLAHAIWAIVLLKCVVPPVVSSSVSPFTWIASRSTQQAILAEQPDMPTPSAIKQAQVDNSDLSSAVAPRIANGIDTKAGPTSVGEENHNALKHVLGAQGGPDELSATSRDKAVSRQAPAAAVPPVQAEQSASGKWPMCVLGLWLAGAIAGIALVLVRFTLFIAWHRRGLSRPTAHLDATIERLCKELKIRSPVRIHVSDRPVGPAVIGLLRPAILLPATLVENRKPNEIEPLLAHELIHIRRGDLWWSMLQTLATSLFWFHPLVWFASKKLTQESERCCDEETVASLNCPPADYARGLLDVLEHKQQLQVAPAVPGVRPVDITSARLERVMKLGNGMRNRTPAWVWLLMLVCGVCLFPGAASVMAQKEASSEASEQNEEYRERRFDVADLLKTIRKTAKDVESAEKILIRECSLEVGEFRGIRVLGTQLIVNEMPKRVATLQKRLDRFRKHGFDRVITEMQLIQINQEQLQKFGIRWTPVWSEALTTTNRASEPNLISQAMELSSTRLNLPKGNGIRAALTAERSAPVLFSVISEMELQRILKMANQFQGVTVGKKSMLTVFNGSDAELSVTNTRCFVTGVNEVVTDNAIAHQPIISTLESGFRTRMKPTLRAGEIDLDCHVRFQEITDAKTAHVSYDPVAESGVSIQVPTIAVTNVEINQSFPLGSSLLIEILADDGNTETDTVVSMLTCRKASPNWAEKSAAEKKQTADLKAAIAAAEKLPVVMEKKPTDNRDVYVVTAGEQEKNKEKEARELEVMGMNFRLEGDVKFEIRNSSIAVSGKRLTIRSFDEVSCSCVSCSCEDEGLVEFTLDNQHELAGLKAKLYGNAKFCWDSDGHYFAADELEFGYPDGDNPFPRKLKGNAAFHLSGTSVAADTISFSSDGKATLTGNVAVHRQHLTPWKIFRAEKMVLDLTEIEQAAPNGGLELDTSRPTAVISAEDLTTQKSAD